MPDNAAFVAEDNRFHSTGRSSDAWFTVPRVVGFDAWRVTTGETGNADAFSVRNVACSLADYSASLGGAATQAWFFDQATRQARFRWDPRFAAPAVVDYFRDALSIVP